MVSSLALDPIEKKPLYHYKPGSYILSAGSYGCNFRCKFCQNYHISMETPMARYIAPEELITIARESSDEGNIGIAFTYNEPSTWFEYIYDVANVPQKNDIDIVLVTNGFIEKKPLEELLPLVNAMNIDLKAFNNKFYKEVCGGNLEDVMAIIELASSKCHVELTTLLVNGHNDSEEEVEKLAKWISSINKDMPLHLSRYFPNYKFDAPATPVDRVIRSAEIAKQYLNYVYVGNIPEVDSNTYCPKCGKMLIDREGYRTKTLIDNNICPECSSRINIVI
jgi:pyruvate formate lyase activating enzyme